MFQFSLAKGLFIIAIIAAIAANIVTTQRLRTVTAERDRLRQELGALSIENPSQIAVIRVPGDEPLTWRYRVYVPEDKRYRFLFATHLKAKSAAPSWAGAIVVPEGESTLRLKIFRDPRDDFWKLLVQSQNAKAVQGATSELTVEQIELFQASPSSLDQGVEHATVAIPAGESLRVVDERWYTQERGLVLYGDKPEETDVEGIFGELQPDDGPLNL